MSSPFEVYRPRKIEFKQLVVFQDWSVKVYTITRKEKFESYHVVENLISNLPNLLQIARQSELPTHRMAFLIVHEAREGVLILLNWWTGGEMVETKIFFSGYNTSNKIEPSPFVDKALVCVWELEVFAHERKAWIEHILSNPHKPRFAEYAADTLIQ